jgi:galactose mutarotase-like enzyme
MVAATWIPVTDEVAAVRLSSDELEVDVLPANGADVRSIVDRRTGTSLLWTSPWGTDLRPEEAPTSRDAWLTRAWGGWQLLLPNTGAEATERGKTWGFHGEAGMRAWEVAAAGTSELELTLDLETAPLSLRRAYRVSGPALSVETTVRNRSSAQVEFLWGEHPTYGEDFAAGATLEIGARTLQVEIAEGVGVEAGGTVAWPGPDLDRLPTRTPGRFLFGYLDGLAEGTYRVRNDRLGLAVRVSWPLDVFPCVWLWEEIAFTQDPPWGGQAYAVGIEPQAAYPALGMTELRRRGGHGLTVGPDASLTATVRLNVEHER